MIIHEPHRDSDLQLQYLSCREVYFLIAVGIPFGFQHEHVSLGGGLNKNSLHFPCRLTSIHPCTLKTYTPWEPAVPFHY